MGYAIEYKHLGAWEVVQWMRDTCTTHVVYYGMSFEDCVRWIAATTGRPVRVLTEVG